MGWQKRSLERRYDSSSRHAFVIGGVYKGFIGIFVYSKAQKVLMLQIRGKKIHKDTSYLTTLRGGLKV